MNSNLHIVYDWIKTKTYLPISYRDLYLGEQSLLSLNRILSNHFGFFNIEFAWELIRGLVDFEFFGSFYQNEVKGIIKNIESNFILFNQFREDKVGKI